ncbi:MAG: GPR endopeptidase [Clostridia bacterium]|nr:GPR endopeptidase [Clostridia bacterium]
MFFTERNYRDDYPYTDLACERRRADTSIDGVDYKKEKGIVGIWERIKITSKEGSRSIGRPIGIYDTLGLDRMDMMDNESIDDAQDEIARELCYMCDVMDIVPEKVLVVGLGNPALTPDAVGSETARVVKPTMHIKDFDSELFDGLECSQIAVMTPGVNATSGMDAGISVKGVCEMLEPDVILAVDALASRSTERLGTTVQVSNTGIIPGSGIGNGRIAISRQTMGVPVISIGIPTVIDSRMFWLDAQGESVSRGIARGAGDAMFVSPKEINEIVRVGAKIVGGGINQAFGLFDC